MDSDAFVMVSVNCDGSGDVLAGFALAVLVRSCSFWCLVRREVASDGVFGKVWGIFESQGEVGVGRYDLLRV